MENVRKRNIQKPVGIYVVSIAVIIVLGVYQLFRYWIEYQNIKEDLPFVMVFIPLLLCGFTIFSAIWATFGDNLSRISLLLFVALNFLWWLYLVLMAVSYNESENFNFLFALSTLLRPSLVLGFCWWYLTRRGVVEYYKSVSQ
jgi:cation transport ATPase